MRVPVTDFGKKLDAIRFRHRPTTAPDLQLGLRGGEFACQLLDLLLGRGQLLLQFLGAVGCLLGESVWQSRRETKE